MYSDSRQTADILGYVGCIDRLPVVSKIVGDRGALRILHYVYDTGSFVEESSPPDHILLTGPGGKKSTLLP